jgi:hypothetical protein
MRNATHDDVVEALKNGGDCVTLVVKHLKAGNSTSSILQISPDDKHKDFKSFDFYSAVTPYLRQATSVGKYLYIHPPPPPWQLFCGILFIVFEQSY